MIVKIFSFKAMGKEMATCKEWTSVSTSKIADRKRKNTPYAS